MTRLLTSQRAQKMFLYGPKSVEPVTAGYVKRLHSSASFPSELQVSEVKLLFLKSMYFPFFLSPRPEHLNDGRDKITYGPSLTMLRTTRTLRLVSRQVAGVRACRSRSPLQRPHSALQYTTPEVPEEAGTAVLTSHPGHGRPLGDAGPGGHVETTATVPGANPNINSRQGCM